MFVIRNKKYMYMKKSTVFLLIATVVLFLSSCGGSIESRMQGKWELVGTKSKSETKMSPASYESIYFFKKGKFKYFGSKDSVTDVDWETASSYTFKDDRTVVIDGYAYRIYFSGGKMQMIDDNPSSGLYRTTWYYKRMK